MTKLLVAFSALVLLLFGAVMFRIQSAPEVAFVHAADFPAQTSEALADAAAIPGDGSDSPVVVPAEGMRRAAVGPGSQGGSTRGDHGAAMSVPAITTYVGPDGSQHDIPPVNAELLAMGDEELRAAVMDEIRADPEAFARAMRVEVEDVERVARGESELPARWIVQ